MLGQLKAAGYDGLVSIELEDDDFNGTEDGEKRGLIAGRSFLENA
jgi:sugar phosphate isomerase/epimerase